MDKWQKCPLIENCQQKSAVCNVQLPDETCYWFRWFRALDNPWHTGTPTEGGWYLLHYPECKEQPYELAQWNGEHFVAVKPFHAIIVYIDADTVPMWQKIEEKEDER